MKTITIIMIVLIVKHNRLYPLIQTINNNTNHIDFGIKQANHSLIQIVIFLHQITPLEHHTNLLISKKIFRTTKIITIVTITMHQKAILILHKDTKIPLLIFRHYLILFHLLRHLKIALDVNKQDIRYLLVPIFDPGDVERRCCPRKT